MERLSFEARGRSRPGKTGTAAALWVLAVAIGSPAFAQAQPAATDRPQNQAASQDTSQPSTAADQDNLGNDIIVTAQRRPQSILDAPVSATVFDARAIEAAQYNDAKDYLLQTPNVSFQQGGRNGAREVVIAIRGISDLKSSEKVLTQSAFTTYVDEFAAGTLASGQANPDIYDVEAVEILRGPQGVFFGRNSEGGAINIRTKKPTEEFYGRVDAGIGRFNTYDLGGVINGRIAEGLAARVSINGSTTQGPIRNLGPAGGGSDAQYLNARGQLRWRPDARTTIDFEANYTLDNSGIQPKLSSCINQGAFGLPYNLATPQLLGGIGCYNPNGAFTDWVAAGPGGTRPQLGGKPVSAFPNNERYVYQDTPDHTDNRTTLVIGKVYRELSDAVALTAIAGYSQSNQDQFLDLDRSGINAINRLGKFKTNSWSVEGRLSSIGKSSPIDWTVGGIVYREHFDAINQILIEQVLGPWAPGDKANENEIQNTVNGWAAFANVEWHVTPQLSLILGGRYSYDKGVNQWSNVYAACARRLPGEPLDTSQVAAGNGPCVLTPSQQLLADRGGLPQYWDAGRGAYVVTGGRYEQLTGRYAEGSAHDFSPRIALNWKPNGDTSIYVSASKGYKPAGGQANPDSGIGGSSTFGREKLWNFEIGGNAYMLDRRLLVQAAVFDMEWTDYQFLVRQGLCQLPSGALVPVTASLDLSTCKQQFQVDTVTNLPRARSRGFELSATARPFGGLTIGGSVGYLDAKYVRGSGLINGAQTNLAGIRIGNAPPWTASANIDETFPALGGKSSIGLNWSYRSGTSLGVVEQATQTFPGSVKPISLFNLRLSQTWGKSRLIFTVNNLLNRKYYTAVEGFSFVGPQLTYNPRTWAIHWTSEF
ncbi:MAG: TonB-dependent receptor [Pseudomonadota bacterium]